MAPRRIENNLSIDAGSESAIVLPAGMIDRDSTVRRHGGNWSDWEN